MQEEFIKQLRAKISDNMSLTEIVRDILDINYDAAYRRVTGKTSISLEEAVKLSKHFKLSLNSLFEVGSQSTIVTDLSPRPINEKGLELWFIQSLQNVKPLVKVKKAEIIWSGKDISLFRTLTDSFLTRYKMYVWLKDLDVDMAKSKITFDEWVTKIPKSLLESAFELSEVYNHINITELWSDTTINGTLQQVLYYFEAGMVSRDMALKICKDIHQVINQIEEHTINQSMNNNTEKHFKLYKCDLHTLTNTVMVVTPSQKAFFTPFTVLSYFKIENEATCNMMYEFLNKQMSNSKLLATAGEKDRALFFKTIHNKITLATERINLDYKMNFL
ncbi:MAG: hypothetical protein ED556_11555 [Winogradskyella sp.]|uniref:hypothetical protein n=1 Tax=Winogradskyella sp. TaxID=1883156 RepID=UPI000F3F56BA|nr:hypothetical protein [Winogradskyella sp.]RNC84091.1 MAG: hypothetical protein ED556_11555 [Winogradskyella sp.]